MPWKRPQSWGRHPPRTPTAAMSPPLATVTATSWARKKQRSVSTPYLPADTGFATCRTQGSASPSSPLPPSPTLPPPQATEAIANMGTITAGGGIEANKLRTQSLAALRAAKLQAATSLPPPGLTLRPTPCHVGNSNQRSQHLRGMVSGIKSTVSYLDTPPTQLANAHQHSLHVQRATSPAVSHTYADQRLPLLDTWITSAEAGQLQNHSGGAQTCKHGDVLTFKVSGENLTCCQPHRTIVHIEDNSHITRSVITDYSWQRGKTMDQQDGNSAYIQYMQPCIGHSS